MERYFVTHIKNEVLDVNAHNKKEQKIIKHPVKDKWAVRVLPGNRYIEAKLAGTVVALYQVTGLPGRKTTITEQ